MNWNSSWINELSPLGSGIVCVSHMDSKPLTKWDAHLSTMSKAYSFPGYVKGYTPKFHGFAWLRYREFSGSWSIHWSTATLLALIWLGWSSSMIHGNPGNPDTTGRIHVWEHTWHLWWVCLKSWGLFSLYGFNWGLTAVSDLVWQFWQFWQHTQIQCLRKWCSHFLDGHRVV